MYLKFNLYKKLLKWGELFANYYAKKEYAYNIDVRQGNNIALFIILQSYIATTTKRGKKRT